MTPTVTKLTLVWCLAGPISLSEASESSPSPPMFLPPVHYPSGKAPHSLASGDLNGDGAPDLVTADRVDGTASVLLNDGRGGFRTRLVCPVGDQPRGVALGDFNGDGWLDVATHNVNENEVLGPAVSILLNRRRAGMLELVGQFESVRAGVDYVFPRSVAAGDVDADGTLDLVLGFQGADFMTVLFGTGDGAFSDLTALEAVSHTAFVGLAHLDGDDTIDVFSSGGTWHRGLGGRQFSLQPLPARLRGAAGGVAADIDADGDPDLLVASLTTPGVILTLENHRDSAGSAILSPRGSPIPTGDRPEHLVAADLDSDGDVDLAAANHGSGEVSILENRGDGSLLPSSTYELGRAPRWIVADDFNGDGRLDLATAGFNSDDVSVLLADSFESRSFNSTLFVRGKCGGGDQARVALEDAVVLLNFNFVGGAEPPCLAACDANGDGRVRGRVDDGLYLLNFLFLGGPQPVSPFPRCGWMTQTDVALGCETEPFRCARSFSRSPH